MKIWNTNDESKCSWACFALWEPQWFGRDQNDLFCEQHKLTHAFRCQHIVKKHVTSWKNFFKAWKHNQCATTSQSSDAWCSLIHWVEGREHKQHCKIHCVLMWNTITASWCLSFLWFSWMQDWANFLCCVIPLNIVAVILSASWHNSLHLWSLLKTGWSNVHIECDRTNHHEKKEQQRCVNQPDSNLWSNSGNTCTSSRSDGTKRHLATITMMLLHFWDTNSASVVPTWSNKTMMTNLFCWGTSQCLFWVEFWETCNTKCFALLAGNCCFHWTCMSNVPQSCEVWQFIGPWVQQLSGSIAQWFNTSTTNQNINDIIAQLFNHSIVQMLQWFNCFSLDIWLVEQQIDSCKLACWNIWQSQLFNWETASCCGQSAVVALSPAAPKWFLLHCSPLHCPTVLASPFCTLTTSTTIVRSRDKEAPCQRCKKRGLDWFTRLTRGNCF